MYGQYLCAVLVAVVVTYSATRRDLERCISALRSGGGVDRIVLVDTGGSAIVDDLPGNPPCEVIRVANRGYGADANTGFARAAALGADRVALLNDDVIVRPGSPAVDAPRACSTTEAGARRYSQPWAAPRRPRSTSS